METNEKYDFLVLKNWRKSMTDGRKFPHLHVAEHPLIQHKPLTLMRDQSTTTQNFRQLLREIAMLLGYEITRDLALAPRQVTTPPSRNMRGA